MKTKLGVLLVLSIAGLAAAVSVARPASTDGTLQATVGPGYSINLTQNGVKVTHLDPGSYTIDVNDQADVHNFDLVGPGVHGSPCDRSAAAVPDQHHGGVDRVDG